MNHGDFVDMVFVDRYLHIERISVNHDRRGIDTRNVHGFYRFVVCGLFVGTAKQDSKEDHKQDTKSCDDTCKHKFFHMKNDNSGFCTHLLPPFPALVYSMQGIHIHAFNFKLPIGINFSKCIKNSKSG